jgi:hypothetical protein
LEFDESLFEGEGFSFRRGVITLRRFEDPGPVADDLFNMNSGVFEILGPWSGCRNVVDTFNGCDEYCAISFNSARVVTCD